MSATIARGHSMSGAVFSLEDWPRYRYSLWRRWREGGGHVLFVLLNPSTADEHADDPTIRRCRQFAQDWGYGGIVVCNLYAFRATNPSLLWTARDPIGPENERILRDEAVVASLVICAWGSLGARDGRGKTVYDLLHARSRLPIWALGWTLDGQPRHPLYLTRATMAQPWILPENAPRAALASPEGRDE